MLTEIQQELVDALRSGQFEQTQGRLSGKNGGYCCLGVACKVYEEREGVILESLSYEHALYSSLDEVVEAFGFRESEGKFSGKEIKDKLLEFGEQKNFPISFFEYMEKRDRPVWHLTELNDDAKLTFPQIADVIEEFSDYIFERPWV